MLAVVHDVEHSTRAQGDDRAGAGEGLCGRDAEVLDAGLDEAERSAVELAQLLPVDPLVEMDVGSGQSAQPDALGAALAELIRSPELVVTDENPDYAPASSFAPLLSRL